MTKNLFLVLMLCALVFSFSCTKSDDNNDSKNSDSLEITDNLKDPSLALEVALISMSSAMDTDISSNMVSSLALPLNREGGFNADDCDEHAEPLARSGDDNSYKDSSGRLSLNHPRMPLQDFYCKMQTDTGAPDSFLGALSGNKLMFCIIGDDLIFNGETIETTKNFNELLACAGDDLTEEEKEEMFGDVSEDVVAKITSSLPAEFGADSWDASVQMTVELVDVDENIKILLKDSDDILAIATSTGSGRAKNTDAYVVAIDKVNGEIRFDSKFQRIRSPDGTSSNGWNRHATAYVKGEFDDDLIFASVSSAYGAFSDISINAGDTVGSSEDSPLQAGSFWTLEGNDKDGFKTYSYNLNCTYVSRAEHDCEDANLAKSWVATDGAGACNGVTSGETCESKGIELSKNTHTSFVMDIKSEDFQTTEDWFDSLEVPTFTSITLSINQ